MKNIKLYPSILAAFSMLLVSIGSPNLYGNVTKQPPSNSGTISDLVPCRQNPRLENFVVINRDTINQFNISNFFRASALYPDLIESFKIAFPTSFTLRDFAQQFIENLSLVKDSELVLASLKSTLSNQSSSDEVIRDQLINTLELAKRNDEMSYILYHKISFFAEVPSVSSLEQLISFARRNTPESLIYSAMLNQVVSEVNSDAKHAPLNENGFIAINRFRIMNDLVYLGYSCADAVRLSDTVNPLVVSNNQLNVEYGSTMVTYGNASNSVRFTYPRNYSFTPVNSYKSRNPIKTESMFDRDTVYRGQYRVTDFAHRKFDNVKIDLISFGQNSVVLNLMRAFPDRNFTVRYNPRFWAARGVSNLPSYLSSQIRNLGLNASNISFEVDSRLSIEPEGFGYSWSRDGWLSAHDSRGRFVKLKESFDRTPVQSGYIAAPIITEGGGIYPIGRHFFVSKGLWKERLERNPSLTKTQLEQNILRLTGRQPILLDYQDVACKESEFFCIPDRLSGHIDTFMLFLPSTNQRPFIGIADPNMNVDIVRGLNRAQLKDALKYSFLYHHTALKDLRAQRLKVSDFKLIGAPSYHPFNSMHAEIGKLLFELNYDQDYLTQLNSLASSLSNQGFRVFRYPAGQSNGFPEVTRRSARFITNSASLVAFEQHFARIVNNLGYDIDLIPTTEGIQESAGLHCNTNEMRVSH